ncbi:zinc finger protein HD1-like [Phalaenopsis equestris]|uniref:zinc finger protein HD1-like n=1 Tax=Phalaenopsis equestris TaxID=78828 RepID=UPI0009E45B95|nr:zinc finger protein HD1-like [Phalaenopsis equestris]
MASIYHTNQLNQLISAPPAYTSYSPDPIVSQNAMNLSSCLGMDPSTFNTCSFTDAATGFGGLHYNDGAGVGFGIFADTGIAARQLEAMEPCSLGIYSTAPMQSAYDLRDLQVLSDSNELMAACNTSTGPLPMTSIDLSSYEETSFKVPQLTLEEKKKKISRYMEKKIARNYSKKIKYACRKTLADSRHRVRGRFAKNDEVPQAALRPPKSVDH